MFVTGMTFGALYSVIFASCFREGSHIQITHTPWQANAGRQFATPLTHDRGFKLTQDPELTQQIEMLRERLSRLSEASVRINESLDLNVVLQDVIDNGAPAHECQITDSSPP